MFQVLVPIDSRFISKNMLKAAAMLACEQNAKITLLCITRDERVRTSRALQNAMALFSEFGSRADIRLAHGGSTEKLINSAAASLDADLIVLGSATEKQLRKSSVPVLVVREIPEGRNSFDV